MRSSGRPEREFLDECAITKYFFKLNFLNLLTDIAFSKNSNKGLVTLAIWFFNHGTKIIEHRNDSLIGGSR